MQLVTYDLNGLPQPALLRGTDLIDITNVESVLDLIRLGDAGRRLTAASLDGAARKLDEVRLLAPIPHPNRFIMATGFNYLAHFDDGIGRRGDGIADLPEFPSFFSKADTTVTGPRESIPFDASLSEQLDWEAEIAVVIGRRGRNIPPDAAASHVFGYMLANDVTARDIQRRHGGQWFKGKSIDGSCPMGPWLLTADEVVDGEPFDLRCTVNGEVQQEATTDLMIFSIPELVSQLSSALTLEPGDILLTGTPEGVGYARNPPRFLEPGDEVVVSSSKLGQLRNRVVEQQLTTYVQSDDPGDSRVRELTAPGRSSPPLRR